MKKTLLQYLEDVRTGDVKLSRIANLKLQNKDEGMFGKKNNSLTYVLSAHRITDILPEEKITYEHLIRSSKDNFFDIPTIDKTIKEIEELKERGNIAIETLKKFKKIKNKLNSKEYNFSSEGVALKALRENILTEYKKEEPYINNIVDKISKIILGEFELYTDNIEHKINYNGKKASVDLKLHFHSTVPKIGITKIPTSAPKTTIENQANRILSDKLQSDGPIETIGRMIADEINSSNKIDFNVKYIGINPNTKAYYHTQIPSGPLTPLVLQKAMVYISQQITFEVVGKKK